jgi:hypothetical protein
MSRGVDPAGVRVVTSTREAAECLLYRWPVKRGALHLRAVAACHDVLAGLKDPKFARKAFEAAAKEADILLDGAGTNPFATVIRRPE